MTLTVARQDRAVEASRLRELGLLNRQIAERMGISISHASALINDPDGAKTRARKASYGRPCPGCGKRMDGSNGRGGSPKLCVACTRKKQHEERHWTRARIVEAFQRFEREMGSPPVAVDHMTRRRPGAEFMPVVGTVQHEFGTWNAAVRAAGLEPMPVGQHRADWRGSKQDIVGLLQAWAAEHGRTPSKAEWPRSGNGHPGPGAIERVFGTWSAALNEAGLPPRRPGGGGARGKWTNEGMLAALQAWAAEHGRSPTSTAWRYAEPGRPSCLTVSHRFGGWRRALEAAGLPPPVPVYPPHPSRPPRWTDEQLIGLLQAWAAEHGRSPRIPDWLHAEEGRPCADTIKSRFKRWSLALDAAGLPRNRSGGKQEWTDERLVAALRATARELGRRPRGSDWQHATSEHPTYGVIYGRFGSWPAGLEAAGLTEKAKR